MPRSYLKNPEHFYISFFRRDAGLFINHLSAWTNFCLFLVSFLLHSLVPVFIRTLINSSSNIYCSRIIFFTMYSRIAVVFMDIWVTISPLRSAYLVSILFLISSSRYCSTGSNYDFYHSKLQVIYVFCFRAKSRYFFIFTQGNAWTSSSTGWYDILFLLTNMESCHLVWNNLSIFISKSLIILSTLFSNDTKEIISTSIDFANSYGNKNTILKAPDYIYLFFIFVKY